MPKPPCVLVLVTVQRECDRLICRGKEVAAEYDLPLHVIHVSTNKTMLGNPDASEALNYLYRLAGEADAEMNILYADNALSAIAAYAKNNNAKHIVLGTANHKHPESGFTDGLISLLPRVQFDICRA